MSGDTAFRTVRTERRGDVLLVTLDRPQARNALDERMMTELRELWTSSALDGVRCVVVAGNGAGFCAGADVSMLEGPRDETKSVDEELAFLPGERVDVPVIVAVHGACAGGGLHFVADADITIASRSAIFLDPHVSVGQVGVLEPLMLRLRMRPDILMRMVLLGTHERLDAAAAQACGLVSEVVDDEQLIPRALELAERIASNSPTAVARSRAVLRRYEQRLLGPELELGWEAIRNHWSHPDATEGPAAFLAKRTPDWSAS